MARRQKAPTAAYQVEAIKRIGGSTGSFDIRIATPGGTVREAPTSLREIRGKVDAYSGRPEPQCIEALKVYLAAFAAFPNIRSGMAELAEFADTVGFEIPPEATDAARAWEALFGEKNPEGEHFGGESFPLPEDADEEVDTEVLTGLETDAKTDAETDE